MDDYSLLRQIADSWGLLALFAFFIGAVIYVYRPGSAALHADAAQVPLRDDEDMNRRGPTARQAQRPDASDAETEK